MNHRDTETPRRDSEKSMGEGPARSRGDRTDRLRRTPPLRGGFTREERRKRNETIHESLCFHRSSCVKCRPAKPADVRRVDLRVSVFQCLCGYFSAATVIV